MQIHRLLLLLSLLLGTQVQAAEPSWTGSWDTRWRDGGAQMELQEADGKVTGQYPAYGGRIDGSVEGRHLSGHWTEGARSGGLDFVLAPDGRTFMGRFDNGEWWTGGRVVPAVGDLVVDQSGAREALRTFVQAGNAAREGSLDEMAKAADVVDFGTAGSAMAPGEKLAAAKNLFDLVDQTTFHLWAIPGKRAPETTSTSRWLRPAPTRPCRSRSPRPIGAGSSSIRPPTSWRRPGTRFWNGREAVSRRRTFTSAA